MGQAGAAGERGGPHTRGASHPAAHHRRRPCHPPATQVAAQGEAVKAAKAAAAAAKDDKSLAAASKEAVATLLKLKDQLAKAEEAARNAGGLPRTADGKVRGRAAAGAGGALLLTCERPSHVLPLHHPAATCFAPQVDYSKDFFSKPAYLTVSGQLNGECGGRRARARSVSPAQRAAAARAATGAQV